MIEEIKERILDKEDSLSKYATKSKDSIRLKPRKEDIRPAFFRDTDTIIYSTSYSRYLDKTQVFSFSDNDHISKRMIHVQLVSKIARTIGRCLNLNEDLIEAIALGHDIGHTPIGHVGEKILNDISMREIGIPFMHNMQSARTYMEIKGKNLSIQVLDGMMCHNGEKLEECYYPVKKTKEDFLKDYNEAWKSKDYEKTLKPMTLEGCIVRISDVIAYIGRDLEDAITLGVIKRKDIPKEITDVIGTTNSEIINTLILDIVNNSYEKGKIVISKEIYKTLNKLLDFNYKYVYNMANTSDSIAYYTKGMNKIYDKYLNDLETNNTKSRIYTVFLNSESKEYRENTDNKRIVIDFIAGMTDDFFLEEIETC
jgi:dGTPase